MNGPASGSIADGARNITNEKETNVSETTTNTPFADGFAYIYEGPLGSPIDIPKGSKQLKRKGITGRSGVDMSYADLQSIADNYGDSNVGIRLADEIIGIDVDAYGNKTGGETVELMQGTLGNLPATIKSSRRGAGVSGIYFYRVPAGQNWHTGVEKLGFGGYIDIIQRVHRYSVVYPSVVDGLEYRWYEDAAPTQDSPGTLCEEYPVISSIEDIPWLPEAFQDLLRVDVSRVANVNDEILSTPEEWVFAEKTHGYVATMIDSWAHDSIRDDVHQWIFNQSSRITDAWRLGLVTEADLQRARAALVLRAERELVNRSSSEDPATEVRRCWNDAVAVAQRHDIDQATLSVRNKKDGPVERFDQNTGEEALDGILSASQPLSGTDAQEEPEKPAEPASWDPVDLTSFIDGTYVAEPATIMARTDQVCLMYPGKTHSFHGESESGKSWVAMIAAVECVNNDQMVAYIDFESDAATVVGRMLRLGAGKLALAKNFKYIKPEQGAGATPEELAAYQRLLGTKWALVVFDGVTEALSTLGGVESNDNDAITKWVRRYPKKVAEVTSAAVAVIDHVTKNQDTSGRFAIGGQAKMATITGAAYVVEIKGSKPLGVGLRGELSIRVAKDRPGLVRPHSGSYRSKDRTQEAAVIVVDSTQEGVTTYEIQPPATEVGSDEVAPKDFIPTAMMEKISRAMSTQSGWISNSGLRSLVSGKDATKGDAIARLIELGHIAADGPKTRGANGAPSLRHVSLYTEAGMTPVEAFLAELTD